MNRNDMAQELLNKAPSVTIDGEEYVMVKERVRIFREIYGHEFGMENDVIWVDREAGLCAMAKCAITDLNNGGIVAQGHATAWPGKNHLDAFVEMAETQAVGRALAFFGIAGGKEFASAEEMQDRPTAEVVRLTPPPGPARVVASSFSLKDIERECKKAKTTAALMKSWTKLTPSLSLLSDEAEIERAKKIFADRLLELTKEED